MSPSQAEIPPLATEGILVEVLEASSGWAGRFLVCVCVCRAGLSSDLCVQGAVCFWKGKWKAGFQRGREGHESVLEIILHPKLGGAGVCVSRDGMVSTKRSCLTSHEGSLFTGTGTPFPSPNPCQGLLFLRGLDLSSGHPLAGFPVAQSVHCVPAEAHVGCGAHERGGDFEQAERCCPGREATICFNRSGCLSSRPFF